MNINEETSHRELADSAVVVEEMGKDPIATVVVVFVGVLFVFFVRGGLGCYPEYSPFRPVTWQFFSVLHFFVVWSSDLF